MSTGGDICPTCGLRTIPMTEGARVDYADTQGGHNDRHTLVVEAADRAIKRTPTQEAP